MFTIINYICDMDFKQKIIEKGLKQQWIAKQIGISSVLLSYYLTGTRPMPNRVKEKLETVLK